MFRIAIVDDDKAALSIVSSAVDTFFKEKNIEYNIMSFSNPLNYLATIKEEDFNLIFLDIDMPQQDGFSVATELTAMENKPLIIFLSSLDHLVYQSNLINDFTLMMNQFYNYYLSNNDEGKKIEFVEKNRTISFKINEIVYISSDRNYQDIVTKDNKVETVRIPLSTLEDKLKKCGFIRVHKCYIVNQSYIRIISNEEIKLTKDITIPLSKKRRDEVIKEYLAYSRKNNSMII